MNERRDVYIVDGSRTPQLKARGKPGPFSASDLAVSAGRAQQDRRAVAEPPADRQGRPHVLRPLRPDEQARPPGRDVAERVQPGVAARRLSLIHISEPTRL